MEAEGVVLEQFHNYNIKQHEYIWNHPRYKGMVKNYANSESPNNIIILPGYIKITNKEIENIVNTFKKISNNKEEIK